MVRPEDDVIARFEAIKEAKYREGVQFEEGTTLYDIRFANDGIVGPIGRAVTQVLVVAEDAKIDLCTFAPRGTIFSTQGGIQPDHSGVNLKYSDPKKSIPLASTSHHDDGQSEVSFNPEIFTLRGGTLFFLHEIGHAWDRQRERFVGAAEARIYVLDSINLKPEEVDVEKLKESFELWESGENSAWNYAVEKFKELKRQGINICPALDEGEEDVYPQVVYDELHNRRLRLPFDLIGRKFTWERVENQGV